eukprot:177804-Rhodomonas_salina.1
MKKRGLKRRRPRKTKRQNLGAVVRRHKGGFLGALAASLAPMAIKGIGKLIKGHRRGHGVRFSGAGRGRGFFGKIASVGKKIAKKAFNELKKDPIGNATKAYNL